jgi:hypothetical protein
MALLDSKVYRERHANLEQSKKAKRNADLWDFIEKEIVPKVEDRVETKPNPDGSFHIFVKYPDGSRPAGRSDEFLEDLNVLLKTRGFIASDSPDGGGMDSDIKIKW